MKLISRNTIRVALLALIVLVGSMLANLFAVSYLTHATAQSSLRDSFASQVALATAPTSERDFNNKLVSTGAPVAVVQIDKIGLNETIVEGTDSNTLRSGVGHRRDTVLPGQEGISILFGKAFTYGAPFANIANLKKGDSITCYTGQGKSTYKVTGVRYAGDKGLAPVKAGTGHLVLTSAIVSNFTATGVVRVDAELQGQAFTSGERVTKWAHIPAYERELAYDDRYAWLLVVSLALLVVLEFLAIWSRNRFGLAKTWLVYAPAFAVVIVIAANQFTLLLPNLL